MPITPLDNTPYWEHFLHGKVLASLSYIKNGSGNYVPWDGSVSVSVSTSGGAINDGVTGTIKATVIDYLHSASTPASANPLSVILTGTDGVPYNASGGGGGGAVTVANGADVTQGAIADAKVVGDNTGTLSAKLRGLNYLLALVTDQGNSRLNVAVATSALPTGASTLTEQQTQTTALQLIDNPVGSLTGGSAGTSSFAAGGIYNLSQPTLTTGQQCALQLDVNGNLRIVGTITANAGTNLNTSALALESGGNLATLAGIVSSSRAAVNLIAAQSGITGGAGAVAANTPRVTLASDDPAVAVLGATGDAAVTAGATGSISAKLRSISRDLVANIVLAAGTNVIGKVSIDQTTPGTTNKVNAVGNVADDATTPQDPVMIGGTAKSPDGTDPGSVSAENDIIRLIGDLNRRLYTNPNHPNSNSYHEDSSSTLTNTTVVSAPGAGFEYVITNIRFSTGAATAFNLYLDDGTSKLVGPYYLEAVAGRGFASGPIWRRCGANKGIRVSTSAAIAHSIDIDYCLNAV